MLPSIFGENLFDDFFDDFDDFDRRVDRYLNWRHGLNRELYGKKARNMMKTDVRETDGTYELDIDLPGFAKDEIDVKMNNGYLTISASKGLDKDQKDNEGRYIRRERYTGQSSRSFYVGDSVAREDVTAKFEDGILRLTVPKKVHREIPQTNYIAIE